MSINDIFCWDKQQIAPSEMMRWWCEGFIRFTIIILLHSTVKMLFIEKWMQYSLQHNQKPGTAIVKSEPKNNSVLKHYVTTTSHHKYITVGRVYFGRYSFHVWRHFNMLESRTETSSKHRFIKQFRIMFRHIFRWKSEW